MLSFAATGAFTTTRYVAVRGPVSPATVRFIMAKGRAVRASFDERSNHLEVTKVALTVSHPVRLY